MIKVCDHLKNQTEEEYIKFFTGLKKEFICICLNCDANKKKTVINFSYLDETEIEDLYLEEIKGRPELIENIDENIFLKHEYKKIDIFAEKNILFTLALEKSDGDEYLFLTDDRKLFTFNFEILEINELPLMIEKSKIDFNKNIEIKISADYKLLAVYNLRGQYGMVYNLEHMTELIELNRGDYHVEVTPYTFEFFEYNNKTLMITARDWNMIDVIDPYSKQVLTKRDWDHSNRKDSSMPEFRSSVYISPDKKWIVEDGWAWHPIGAIFRWDLNKWIEKNKWEANSGKSLKCIKTALYSWGNPVEWLDNNRLMVWGYGNDDDYILPAIVIYDINTCEELNWFYGPGNNITYDGFLFSFNKKSIWDEKSNDSNNYFEEKDDTPELFCVWDVEKGELIFEPSVV